MLSRALRSSTAASTLSRRYVSHPSPSPSTSSTRVARSYTAAAHLSSPRCDHVRVPCRSNGSVVLNIHHPITAVKSSPILIYLPSSSVLSDQPNHEEDEALVSRLSASSGGTVVQINYRSSSEHQFPTPVHDVLTGYDWILRNLLPGRIVPASGTSEFASSIIRIGVCGELVGGSLATMLALTECRLGESRIGAAAVANPILDWAFPDDLPVAQMGTLDPTTEHDDTFSSGDGLMSWWTEEDGWKAPEAVVQKKATQKPKPSSWKTNSNVSNIPTSKLLNIREILFRNPEHYFDRFASPLCFFRSPSGELVYPADEDTAATTTPEELQVSDAAIDLEAQLAIEHMALQEYKPKPRAPTRPLPTLTRARTYARMFPPSTANLALPHMRIASGSQSPLLDQAAELARVMRRSIARQRVRPRHSFDMPKAQSDTEKARNIELAEGQVQLDIDSGTGLWSHPERGGITIESVGSWLRDRLV